MSKVIVQDLQDELQTVLTERYDEVRKDCMCMPAGGAEDPEDFNPPADWFSINKTDQVA